jgi:hypothetical protein
MSVVPLDDIPKKTQYVMIESGFVTGTNSEFALDLTLESNVHVEDMSRVLGIKLVDFYITQIGENDATLNNNVAKYVDIVCPEVPKVAQLLDERHGRVFARIPLERHFTGSSGLVLRDKQWKSFHRKTVFFNPISIKKLNFKIYESQDDGDYQLLKSDAKWYMVLEITTVNVKEPPKDRELQILKVLEQLLSKIDILNAQVAKLPDKKDEEKKQPKKYSFGLLVMLIITLFGTFLWTVNRKTSP